MHRNRNRKLLRRSWSQINEHTGKPRSRSSDLRVQSRFAGPGMHVDDRGLARLRVRDNLVPFISELFSDLKIDSDVNGQRWM